MYKHFTSRMLMNSRINIVLITKNIYFQSEVALQRSKFCFGDMIQLTSTRNLYVSGRTHAFMRLFSLLCQA